MNKSLTNQAANYLTGGQKIETLVVATKGRNYSVHVIENFSKILHVIDTLILK